MDPYAEEAMRTEHAQHEKQLADSAAAAERNKTFVRDKEMAAVTAGYYFRSPAAADQFKAIVSPKLQAYPNGESFVVRTETFQTAEEFLGLCRADPQYAHFFAQSTAGEQPKGDSNPTASPPPAQPDGPPVYKNLGEELVANFLERTKNAPPDPFSRGKHGRRTRHICNWW